MLWDDVAREEKRELDNGRRDVKTTIVRIFAGNTDKNYQVDGDLGQEPTF